LPGVQEIDSARGVLFKFKPVSKSVGLARLLLLDHRMNSIDHLKRKASRIPSVEDLLDGHRINVVVSVFCAVAIAVAVVFLNT
jgi:hypothetical protein